MKQLLLIVLCINFIVQSYSQGNRVFSGSESLNFSDIDISNSSDSCWSTDRTSNPGYFSFIEKANCYGYSDDANIDGYVKKYGNASFVFPVGNGKQLRALEIAKPIDTSDAYATAWIEGNPSNNIDPTAPNAGLHSVVAVMGSIETVSKIGQWDWLVGENENLGNGTTGNGAGLQITVSMPDMSAFAHESELRLVGWNGTAWIDLSKKASATGNKKNSKLKGTMVAGITAIAIGKIHSIPFTQIKWFNATAANCNALLKWTTSFENKETTFIIEQSLDGTNFYPITTIPSTASITGNTYSTQVLQQNAIAYYRIKMNYNIGSYSYSDVIFFNNKCNQFSQLQIFPNPITNNEIVTIRYTSLYETTVNLLIYNSAGQVVYKNTVPVKEGINDWNPNIKYLPQGNYAVTITSLQNNPINITKQLIKQ